MEPSTTDMVVRAINIQLQQAENEQCLHNVLHVVTPSVYLTRSTDTLCEILKLKIPSII